MATSRSTSGHHFNTPAANAFLDNYGKLIDSIQEPDLIALGAQFFSLKMISRETMEMVGKESLMRVDKASKLILSVMVHLDVHPDGFESAVNVFKCSLVYAELSTLISTSYTQQGQYSR